MGIAPGTIIRHSGQDLKFFNVYGPNEYHKGQNGKCNLHSYNQIKKMAL